MKRYILEQIATKLNSYRKIYAIERVADTILKVAFDGDNAYYFDMKKGDAHIFKCNNLKKAKIYQAPFDLVLKKRFANSLIKEVKLHPRDNILQIVTTLHSKYKELSTTLQFEFTGRHTNIIILDDKGIVLEALRHIDISNSFREVKVGVELLELPPREFKPKISTKEKIEDIDEYLYKIYTQKEELRLEVLKKSKLSNIDKKLKKLQKIFFSLEDEETLLKKAQKYELWGNIILSNIYKINNYQTKVVLNDFEGNELEIELPPKAKTPAMAADLFFKRSKKFKQKAKHSSIERENLESKIAFLQNLKNMVTLAKSSDEVELLVPKQKRTDKKERNLDSNIENFYILGYKISIGKNEKGNAKLLKSAKMGDIWMHLKDIPSTHVIISNAKKSPPSEVLEFGAKLCVNFTTAQTGTFLVDYTYRRDVKVIQGAKVEYKNFKTISVKKE